MSGDPGTIYYRYLSMKLETAGRHLSNLTEKYQPLDATLARRMRGVISELTDIAGEAKRRERRDPLPPGQSRAMVFLQDFIRDQGRAPSRSEMAKGLGYRSSNAAECVLRRLAWKGYLCLLPRVNGGIRLRRSYDPPA